MQDYKALSPADVEQKMLRGRIGPLPLVDLLLFQPGACVVDDTQDRRDILRGRGAAADGLGERDAPALLFHLFVQLPIVLILGNEALKQVGPLFLCAPELLAAAPFFDFLVVAVEEDLRHFPALPQLRAGVLRVFEQAVPMALADVALLVRKHARNEAAHPVGHGHGSDLPAGQHEVAQRDLLVDARLDEALVHALVVAADQHQMVVIPLQASGGVLGKALSLRGEVDHPAVSALCRGHDVVQAAFERLRHHHAAPAAAVGIVVDLALLVLGEVPDLDAVDLDRALFGRAADDALMQHGVHRVGKER